jgi:hypothetical protein
MCCEVKASSTVLFKTQLAGKIRIGRPAFRQIAPQLPHGYGLLLQGPHRIIELLSKILLARLTEGAAQSKGKRRVGNGKNDMVARYRLV